MLWIALEEGNSETLTVIRLIENGLRISATHTGAASELKLEPKAEDHRS